MKKLLALAAIALLAGSAFAQIDPDPDGMGVYFDMEGLVNCQEVAFTGGPQFVNAYLLLTNPSGAQVLAWEARVISDIASLSPGSWVLNGGLNVGTDPDFIVGMGSNAHLVTGPTVLLASRSVMFFMITGEYAIFTVKGVPGSASFPDGTPGYQAVLGVMTPAQSPTGSFDAPQSFVNGSCSVVANEDMAWGSVKSLY
jgi:hypothetical protein